jgi:hypothetical protein
LGQWCEDAGDVGVRDVTSGGVSHRLFSGCYLPGDWRAGDHSDNHVFENEDGCGRGWSATEFHPTRSRTRPAHTIGGRRIRRTPASGDCPARMALANSVYECRLESNTDSATASSPNHDARAADQSLVPVIPVPFAPKHDPPPRRCRHRQIEKYWRSRWAKTSLE